MSSTVYCLLLYLFSSRHTHDFKSYLYRLGLGRVHTVSPVFCTTNTTSASWLPFVFATEIDCCDSVFCTQGQVSKKQWVTETLTQLSCDVRDISVASPPVLRGDELRHLKKRQDVVL